MPQLLWDASALAKHYAPEIGSSTVNALFAVAPALHMATTYMGYAETCAILRRKRNQSAITASAFTVARGLLDSEVFHGASFDLITIDDTAVLTGIALADTQPQLHGCGDTGGLSRLCAFVIDNRPDLC